MNVSANGRWWLLNSFKIDFDMDEYETETIGCYITGILPRPKELVEITRVYEMRNIDRSDFARSSSVSDA